MTRQAGHQYLVTACLLLYGGGGVYAYFFVEFERTSFMCKECLI